MEMDCIEEAIWGTLVRGSRVAEEIERIYGADLDTMDRAGYSEELYAVIQLKLSCIEDTALRERAAEQVLNRIYSRLRPSGTRTDSPSLS